MIIANILGAVTFLFIMWKRLKEDYHSDRIFNLSIYTLTGLFAGYLISLYKSDIWFWSIGIGAAIGYLMGRARLKINFFESFEAVSIGFLPWIGLIFLNHSINNSSLSSFLAFWASLCLIFLFFFLDTHYKNFSWYKSGRVGFAGLVVGITFFLLRIIVSLLKLPVISFWSNFDWVFSSLTMVVFMIMLYKLTKQ